MGLPGRGPEDRGRAPGPASLPRPCCMRFLSRPPHPWLTKVFPSEVPPPLFCMPVALRSCAPDLPSGPREAGWGEPSQNCSPLPPLLRPCPAFPAMPSSRPAAASPSRSAEPAFLPGGGAAGARGLSRAFLPRAPTAAARGTPPSTTCARAPCCAARAGSPPTRLPPAAREPRWAEPSPLALPPPVSRSPAATAVWGAVGGAASGTAWSPAPTSWAAPALGPR